MKLKAIPPLALLLTTCTISSTASAETASNQIIIKYKDSSIQTQATQRLQGAEIAARGQGVGLKFKREMSGKATVAALDKKLTKTQLKQLLSAIAQSDPTIEYIEEDLVLRANLTPNDPLLSQQWHYQNPGASAGGINLEKAWNISTGQGINVAVIDTGYRPHTDLAANILSGYDFITDISLSNDGNGRDSDAKDPGTGCAGQRSSWHGTHVAGTIAAKTNNGVGVAGIAYNSRIIPVRTLGCGGAGNLSDIADGVVWAAGGSVPGIPTNKNPADVINMSLGGDGACGSTMQNAINSALNRNAAVVVSAGNDNTNANGVMPANCNGVITVAAVGPTGAKAYYSNYGSTIEIAAPGGDANYGSQGLVLSTSNSGTISPSADNYSYLQGTSMAAPHISGVVALIKSIERRLTPDQISKILRTTARTLTDGSSNCGAGVVDAFAAVNSSKTALVPFHRYWNSSNTDHLYTIDRNDTGLAGYGYSYETVEGYLSSKPRSGFVPLYRYWNSVGGDHLYTITRNDSGYAGYGYKFEKIEAYVKSTSASGFAPLNRYFNNSSTDHFYSPIRNDIGYANYGYSFENIEGYVQSNF